MNSSISSSELKTKIFFWIIVVVVMTIGAIYWFIRFYYSRTGDLMRIGAVAQFLVDHGDREPCLYSNIITSNTDETLKFELLDRLDPKPEILALGSSRVLEFFQPMFRRSFLNMGRAFQEPERAADFQAYFSQHGYYPKLVLLGVDFWWFNKAYSKKIFNASFKRVKVGGDLNPEDFTQIKILYKKTKKNPEYLSFIPDILDMPSCPLGVASKLRKSGFLADGGIFYGYLNVKGKDLPEWRFGVAKKRIENREGRFSPGTRPDERHVDMIVSFVRKLENVGVRVVVYAPPVAPSIHAAMIKTGRYAYIRRAFSRLREAGVELHDYFDPNRLKLTDCEFLDGFHPGDVANAVLLLDLSEKVPDLAKWLDLEFLRRMAMNRDRAMILYSELFDAEEKDFLGLGCRRVTRRHLWTTPAERRLKGRLFYPGARIERWIATPEENDDRLP